MEREEGAMQLTPCTKVRQRQQTVCKNNHVLGKEAEKFL